MNENCLLSQHDNSVFVCVCVQLHIFFYGRRLVTIINMMGKFKYLSIALPLVIKKPRNFMKETICIFSLSNRFNLKEFGRIQFFLLIQELTHYIEHCIDYVDVCLCGFKRGVSYIYVLSCIIYTC